MAANVSDSSQDGSEVPCSQAELLSLPPAPECRTHTGTTKLGTESTDGRLSAGAVPMSYHTDESPLAGCTLRGENLGKLSDKVGVAT